MPTEAESLRKDSTHEKARAAISSCIKQEMASGRKQEQAIGM
jgi:hypothetical protein